jgi:hypothetical protein
MSESFRLVFIGFAAFFYSCYVRDIAGGVPTFKTLYKSIGCDFQLKNLTDQT